MISRITNFGAVNKYNLKNNQPKNYCFKNSYGVDTVSFTARSPILKAIIEKQQNEIPENTRIASEFGLSLLKEGNKLTPDVLKSKIQEFFNANNIKNIDVKNLSELPYAPIATPGGFFKPELREDLNGINGGTVYIGDMPDCNDKDAMTAYISFVSHELTHALQYSNDNSNFGFGDEIKTLGETKPFFSWINASKGSFIPKLQIDPLNYLSLNPQEFNLTKEDIPKLQKAIDNYHLPMLNKPITLKKESVQKALSGNAPFKDTVEIVAKTSINNFINSYKKHFGDISKDKETLMRKAMLKRYIYEFRTEREAYMTACEIIKKQNNIEGNIIYDMVPETYKIVGDVLADLADKTN